jgi:ankyrin repeat protein
VRAKPPWFVWAIPIGIVAVAAYGFWQGTSIDLVNAVRSGDLETVKTALARDPSLVHTKVYPQGYERVDQQRDYQARTGESAWQGRLLIHDAAARGEGAVAMLDLLAGAGADLTARLAGRTLLHLAARDGNLEVATWMLDHGLDADLRNDCSDRCDEAGQTALHDAQAVRADDMSALLLARGAEVDAIAQNGRTPLHLAAQAGQLGGAFVLCRHGADPTRRDIQGQTPFDLVVAPGQPRDPSRSTAAQLGQLGAWVKPDGGCARVAATARSGGTPVSDEAARVVFAETVPR